MERVCIIGSGISALARAWQLKQKGRECVVLECSNKIGGPIQSFREKAYLAEEGPNSIQIKSARVNAFLKSVPGLAEREIRASEKAKKRYIVRDGKLHSVPVGLLSGIKTPLWSLSGKLRALKEPFIPKIHPDDSESVADFSRRRLGDELYEYAINPLIGGIYAGNPEALSVRHAFPKLYDLEQNHGGLIRGALAGMKARKSGPASGVDTRIISFKEGLHELPKLLAQALGNSLHKAVSLQSIRQRHSTWAVEWNGNADEYDQLILTIPAHRLHTLPLAGPLQDCLRAIGGRIRYSPVSVLSLAYRCVDMAHPPDGFGALVPECEGRDILGVLFSSSIFEKRAPEEEVLLTVFLGGERQPHLATPATDRVQRTAIKEVRELLGISGRPTFLHHKYWPQAIPQYELGYGEILNRIEQVERRFSGLRLAGNYRYGVSLTDCIEAALK